MLPFEVRQKPEYPEKSLSKHGREPTTNSTHVWCQCVDLNLGHSGPPSLPSLSPLSPAVCFNGLLSKQQAYKNDQLIGHICHFLLVKNLLLLLSQSLTNSLKSQL